MASETAINPWPTVNHALEKVFVGGMRLAELQKESGGNDPALVSPHAQVSDLIFFLRGCSTPVILRNKDQAMNRYIVIGSAWLDIKCHWFWACHEVAAGRDLSTRRDSSTQTRVYLRLTTPMPAPTISILSLE